MVVLLSATTMFKVHKMNFKNTVNKQANHRNETGTKYSPIYSFIWNNQGMARGQL